MARYRVDVPPSGQPVQAIAPWPVYGVTIDNQTDASATVRDDSGRTYYAAPGQVWGGDVPATVTFTAKLDELPTAGQCVVWLYDTPGEASRSGVGGGKSGGGAAGEWDRLLGYKVCGTYGWTTYVGGGGGEFVQQTGLVPTGARARLGPVTILVRRTGTAYATAERGVGLYTYGAGQPLAEAMRLMIPRGWRVPYAAPLSLRVDHLGYYQPGTIFEFFADNLAGVPDADLWVLATAHYHLLEPGR